jgi:hypothetical protein
MCTDKMCKYKMCTYKMCMDKMCTDKMCAYKVFKVHTESKGRREASIMEAQPMVLTQETEARVIQW